MKRLVFASMITLACGQAKADVIAFGFALKDHVYIYADSSFNSAVVDTLEFADHIFAYGINNGDQRVFDLGGWVRVGDETGPHSWAVYDEMAVTTKMMVVVMSGDSVFRVTPGDTVFSYVMKDQQVRYIGEHTIRNDAHWMRFWGLEHRFEFWVKTKEFRYQIADAYHDLILKLWGDLTWAFFGDPENEENNEKALSAIQRFQEQVPSETEVYTQDFVYSPLGSMRRIVKLRDGAFVAYLRPGIRPSWTSNNTKML